MNDPDQIPEGPLPAPPEATGLPLIDQAPQTEPAPAVRVVRGRAPPAERVADRVAEPPPTAARRRGGFPWFSTLLFLILAGGLYWVWANPQSADGNATALDSLQHQMQAANQAQTQTQQQVETLAPQLQTLSDRVDKLEKQVAAAPAPPPTPAPAEPAPAPAGPSPEVADLGQKIDDLSHRLDALAARPAPAAPVVQAAPVAAPPEPAPAPPAAPPPDPALAQLPQQVAAEQQLVAALQTKLDQAVAAEKTARDQLAAEQKDTLASLSASLGGRIGKLEQGAGTIEGAAEQAGKLSVIQAANVHLQAGEKLGDLPGAPPALARFANVAPPTEIGLREAFPAVADHAREVSRPDTARQPFFTRLFARLQQSVTVRQGDDVIVGDPAAGVLNRAENAMLNGNLPGAVAALRGLHGPAAAAVHDWLDQAQALLSARAALVGMLAPSAAAPGAGKP